MTGPLYFSLLVGSFRLRAMAAPAGVRNVAPVFSATTTGSSSTFSSSDKFVESDSPPNWS